MLITRKSQISGITRTLDLPVTEGQLFLWENGILIQVAFPDLTEDEREFIKSGIVAEEWNQLFQEPTIEVLPEHPTDETGKTFEGASIQAEPQYVPPSKKIYSTKNFRHDKLKQLRPVLKYANEKWPEIIVAGGSIRTVLNCAHEEVSDYDLFFTSFKVVNDLKSQLEEDEWENVFSCPEEKLFTYKKKNLKIQLICEKEYESPQKLLESFDVTACVGAYHQGVIYFSRSFVRSVWTKKLRMMNVSFPVATIKRLVKYAQKGYNISMAAEDFMREISGKTFDESFFRHYID